MSALNMDECPDVACKDKFEMLRKMMGSTGPKKGPAAAATSGAAATSDGGDKAKHPPASSAQAQQQPELELQQQQLALLNQEGCPLDRRELGQATWGLLHTTAANYPEHPTPAQQEAARHLISGLARLYPCSYCAADFRKEVSRDPPAVASRVEFALWLCHQHNAVNRKLGKRELKCNMAVLDERWKTGRAECFPQAPH